MARRPALLSALAAAALLLTLTACTGTPSSTESGGGSDTGGPGGSPDQSVAEACATVNDTLTDAAAGLQQIDPADPGAATTTLHGIADGIGEAADAISNAEVSALLPDLESAFQAAADSMAALAAGDATRAAELNTAIGEVQSSITEFTELCTP